MIPVAVFPHIIVKTVFYPDLQSCVTILVGSVPDTCKLVPPGTIDDENSYDVNCQLLQYQEPGDWSLICRGAKRSKGQPPGWTKLISTAVTTYIFRVRNGEKITIKIRCKPAK